MAKVASDGSVGDVGWVPEDALKKAGTRESRRSIRKVMKKEAEYAAVADKESEKEEEATPRTVRGLFTFWRRLPVVNVLLVG